MTTLNHLIEQLQNGIISFSVIENMINNQSISKEAIDNLDSNNRNALHNSFLLFLDSEIANEDEYKYDFQGEVWNTSTQLINFTTNKIKLINWLINYKKNDEKFLNQQDIGGNSPLHLAVFKQCIVDWRFAGEFKKIAKQLINNSHVNPNLVNLENETPFCKLLIQEINKVDSYPTANEIRELVADFEKNTNFNINYININNNQNLLHIIAKSGSKTDFRINFAINKKSNFYQVDSNGHTPYEIAILNNNFEMLEIIENNKNFDINATIDEFNNTILHRAISSNNKKIIRTLLSRHENDDLNIDFDIKNKNNEKPFKFEDIIIDWFKNLLTKQNETEMMIIDFLKKNECDYNSYITSEQLTWWTLAIRYNLKAVTSYLVNSVLTNANKLDNNPFKNKNYLFDDEVKKEIDDMLDDLSYVNPEIIVTIKQLPDFPNFNELQKKVLEQRVNASNNFKPYQSDQNLSDDEKAIFQVYLDAILDDNEENWTAAKVSKFNQIQTWLSTIDNEASTSYCLVNNKQTKRKLEDEEIIENKKNRKLSSSSFCYNYNEK